MRIAFALLVLLSLPVVAAAQSDDEEGAAAINFKGQVLERGTRAPLAGVLVLVFRGEGEDLHGFEALTDAEGRFDFVDLSPGDWRVLVEPEGYYPLKATEQIVEGRRLEVLYRLERGAYNRFDVIVEGVRNRSKVTRRQVSIEEMAHMPGIYGDPLKVLRTLPGVAQTNAFTSEIVIRGGAPKDARFFAMGLRVPAAFHFGGIRGLFPEGMVDKLVLYPGDFPVYYGRTIGGVIDIVLPERVGERTHGYIDLSLLDSTLSLEVPVAEGVWVAGSARRSYFDAIAAGVGLFVGEEQVLPRYWDVHLQVGWRPATGHDLRVFLLSADDDFVVYSPDDQPQIDEGDLPEASMIQVGATYDWVSAEGLEWTTALLVGWDRALELATLSGLSFVPPGESGHQIEARSLRVAGRSDVSLQVSEAIRALVGVDMVWSDVSLELKPDRNNETIDESGNVVGLPEGTPTVLAQSFEELAGYLELSLAWPGTGLTVIPGARVDHFGQVGATTFDPRLRAQLDLNPDWTLKGAIGLMHQPPRPLENNLTTENRALRPERALQSSAGVSWRPAPMLEAEVVGFFKGLDDLVTLEGVEQIRWRNRGRGRVYGVESLVRWPLRSRFNGWLAYTLSRSERLDPASGRYEVDVFDQTHNLTLFGTYRLPRNWTFGARFRYATGFPLFDVLGLGEVLGRSLDFHQLDIRVDKTWVYDSWTLIAYFDIQNVYNRFNLTSVDSEGGSSSGESHAIPPGVPILPILGVKGEF